MTTTLLSAAVIAEAVVLAGIMTLMLRLRARLGRVSGLPAAVLAQMTELVQEAEALSMDLTEQLGEQMRLCESLTAQLQAAPASAPAPRTQSAAAKKAAPAAKAPVRSRARATTSAEGATRAGASRGDVETAREKGMDPLGIAIQRSLANKRSALA
jgi:hypothetical protein